MHAASPHFRPTIDAVRAWAERERDHLTPSAQETLVEILRRLERLSVQVDHLVAVNNQLLDRLDIAVEVDPATDTVTFRMGGEEQRIAFRRADPNRPVAAKVIAGGGAYAAGAADLPPEDAELRLVLETALESVYQSAHRILKLLPKIPGLPKISSRAITQVRNHLIEHAADGSTYSFGFDMNGPRVKPMHRGKSPWNDQGLVPNVQEFLDALLSGTSPERT